jgi:hypothetical protein
MVLNPEPESLHFDLNYFDTLKMIRDKRYNVKIIWVKMIKKFTQRREDTQRERALRFLCVSASLRDKFLEFCFNNFDANHFDFYF